MPAPEARRTSKPIVPSFFETYSSVVLSALPKNTVAPELPMKVSQL
jgi:hypothetical protein